MEYKLFSIILSLFLLSDISLTIRDESVARVAETKEVGFWDLL